MNIDGLLLSALIKSDKKDALKTFRFVKDKYVSGIEKHVYEFIKKYFSEYKSLPSPKIVKNKFPEFSFYKTSDPVDFYVDEIRKRFQYEKLTDLHSKISEHLLNKNVDEAIGAVVGSMKDISIDSVDSTFSAVDGLKQRIIDHNKAKKNDGVIGVLTGIDVFDKHIGGLQKEYMVLMGRRGVGKTFTLLKIIKGMSFSMQGTIVIVSNEMDTGTIYKRLDSEYAEIPYKKYRRGGLDKDEYGRLKNLFKLYKKLPTIRVINGAGKSVDDIEYELLAIPDLCLLGVDGIYLTDMGLKDEYKNTVNASRSYQRLKGKLGIPVIGTTQMTDDDQTKYARGIEEDVDILIKAYQSKAMRDQRLMGFEALKIREDDVELEFMMDWDFENWIFREHKRQEDEEMNHE